MRIVGDQPVSIVTGEQPLSEQQMELVKQVYSRFEIFEHACRPYHDEARVVREILRLRDPQQDAPDAKEKTLQLHTLKSTFNNHVADQMENLPEPRIMPETPDLSQQAMDLQDALRYIIYDVNNYTEIHRRRAEDLYGPGTAITQIVWDADMAYGKGDVAIIRWPVEAFLWDPKAENIQDARAVIKTSWHPLSWYAEHYPNAAPYIRDEDSQYNDTGNPESQKGKVSGDEGRAMLLEYWYRTYDAKKRKYTVNVAYCAGGALLEEHKNVYMHGMYPFVLDVHSTIEGQPVGEGLVSELASMMRYINRYARYIDTNLRMSSKARMLVREGSGIDRDALADWSQDLIEGSSVEKGRDWDWLQHAPFNGLALNQMVQMQTDLKQDSGMNSFVRGETTGGIVSGKGISALQESGSKIVRLRTDTLNNGFREIVKHIIWLMSEFYDKERMLMLTGRNGMPREVRLTPEKFFGKKTKGAISPPPYTVQVEVQRRDPAVVASFNEMCMQAYTMAAQAQQFFPLSALFELLNINEKDRLLPIIQGNEQYQQQMQQLQQQNAQMMEQLAAMQKENDNLRVTSMQATNALANVGATTGGGYMPNAHKVAQAGGGPETQAAAVNRARENNSRTIAPR